MNERTKVNYDDPKAVALRIFNAILNAETEVRIGWPERLFAFIHANFPSLIDKGLQKNRKIGEEALDADKAKKLREAA
ncbi:MAG: hypothetical protein LRZ85_02660 [Alphaproteobacteria bacterium]|nr:hypothetical protein [Alphaproteobacteria bacterium]